MKETGGILTLRLEEVDLEQDALQSSHGAGPGRFVRLSVSDTGHGIPSEIINRVFDLYFTTKLAELVYEALHRAPLETLPVRARFGGGR